MPLAAGTQLGPYEVVAPLGAGGMGEVYRARDGRLGRDVAVKVLPEAFKARPDRLARFEREARATGALNHPNILAVHDVGRHEGQPYVVFELLDGTTLRARLRHGDRLPLRKCLEIGAQVAHGLDAAHAKGIVHRDLKPENLLVTTDGVVKILDFGLAKLQDEPEIVAGSSVSTQSEAPWRTEAGSLLGTAGYMSPEQVRGHAIDPRSDIFALGAVLHEMLAGAPAFLKATRPETLLAILGEDPPDLAQVRPGVPPPVRGLVRRCLEKDPTERFQSARDLAFALEGLLSGADTLEERHGLAAGPRRTLPRARRWRAPAAVGCLVALAGVAGWLLRRPEAAPALGTPRQITSDPGWENEPALSPDGSFVAYVSDRSGNPDVWVSDVRGGEPLRLTDDPASDTSPAWLPDGSAIVFVSDRGGEQAVWKTPRLGGSATHLVANALDPAISPDGSRVAFARTGSAGYNRIAVASLAAPTLATFLTHDEDGLWDHRQPAWSPDGREIAYADARNLWLVPAAGGRAGRVTSSPGPDGEPAWSPDGNFLFYSSYRDDTLALWRVPVRGGVPARVTLGTGPEVEPSLAGSRLAFSTYLSNMDVVLFDLRSGERQRLPGLRTESTPALSPDGSQVVFNSDRGGTVDLWSQALAGGRPVGSVRRLTDDVATENLPTVSPDGRWLAFGRVLSGQRDIWIMPLAGGLARRITEDPAADKQPAWSLDGTRLAFVSERGGTGHVWVVRVAEGAPVGDPVRLTSGTGEDFFPSWSPDGSRLVFLRRGDSGFGAWVASVDGSAPPRKLISPVVFARWDRAADRVLVAQADGASGVDLRAVDPRTGAIGPLSRPAALRAVGSALPFDVSTDGGLLATHQVETRGDVWVVDAGFPRPSWR
ncbi:MAG TPA: protein kinase [Vicinamibacteria bacterium]|nr:protein kinase [Vicinamibacteria bacterium]